MSEGRFNLSALAVRERAITLFLILLISLGGVMAFFKLGSAAHHKATAAHPRGKPQRRQAPGGHAQLALPEAGVGTPVTLWGDGLAADEVAAAAGTISYELFCALAPRVPVVVRGADA